MRSAFGALAGTVHKANSLDGLGQAAFRTGGLPTRSMVERVIAWTATQNGRRVMLRYIGTTSNNAWLHNRCGAINPWTLANAGLTRPHRVAAQPAPGPH
jgi:hypothetical protein